ncbi:TRAP transporter substrate-binding protein [Maritimibacter harenae]|uniref:TRAP transporter substrate-binding protein n=1 Tax=Maritimibacter harenae TaxID=2606218 RepID=UPI002E2824C6|nr:TRAP transporter substrate-binding protein DctP [Maritimibacter harenae]
MFPDIDTLLRPYGVKALWAMPAFGGGLACRDEHLETIEDWEGKKIRAAGRWQSKQVGATGASPVALPAADIYTALQNGTIDCTLISASIYLGNSLYEVAPYFSDYSFAGNALITMVGIDVWEDLSDEERTAVQDVSDQTTIEGTRTLREMSASEIEQVKTLSEYIKVSDDEMAKLLEIWDPVYQEAMGEVKDEVGTHFVETLYSFTQ